MPLKCTRRNGYDGKFCYVCFTTILKLIFLNEKKKKKDNEISGCREE